MKLADIDDAGQRFGPLWDEAMAELVEEVGPVLLVYGAPPEALRVLKLAVFRALELGCNHWHANLPREPLQLTTGGHPPPAAKPRA